MINCAGCGANMRFDPDMQLLKCDYCERTADPENLKAEIISPESRIRMENKTIYEAKVYTCPQCGAELISDDDTAATFCNYCGASVMFDERTVTMKAPSYVIPFKKSKDQCQKLYSKFVKSALFAPSSLRQNDTVERFRGIYMPYWVYDMGMEDEIHMAGRKSHRSGDYIITDHYDLSTNVRSHSNGVSFDASAAFADELSQSLAPYDFKECKGFSAGYLSGFYADTADVKAEVYESEARDVVSADVLSKVMADPTFRGYSASPSIDVVSSKLKVDRADMAYFPVWFLAVPNKGYVSYAVVNGQTGKVCADVPIDYKKYLLGSVIMSLPIMLILNLFFTPRPIILALITAIFAIVIYVITDKALNLLYTRQHYLDDSGLRSTRSEAMPRAMAQQNKKKAKTKVNTAGDSLRGFWIAGFVITYALGRMGFGAGCVFVMFFSFVMLIVWAIVKASGNKAGGVKVKQNRLVFKQPFREKVKILIKPLIAIGLCVLLMIINPFIDLVYYLCVFAIMILLLTCIWDIVSVHNKLTRRIPRQFGNRGGDENGF